MRLNKPGTYAEIRLYNSGVYVYDSASGGRTNVECLVNVMIHHVVVFNDVSTQLFD